MFILLGLILAAFGVRAIVRKELEFSNEDGPPTRLRGHSAVVVGTIMTVFGIGMLVLGIGML